MGVKIREKPKGSGVWWLFIHHEGKRKSLKIGDKRQANAKAMKYENLIESGKYSLVEDSKKAENKKPLFRHLADEWIENDIKVLRTASTYERYEQILIKHVLPEFGNKRIDEITRGDIRDFLLNKVKKEYSKSSIGLFRDVLGGVFNNALDHELLNDSPVRGISRRIDLTKIRGEHADPLSFEETELFLESCRKVVPWAYPFFFTALRTGMRLGELLGLKWGDVDFNSKYIMVQRAYRRGVFTQTKTKKSRKIDMSDQLVTVLKEEYTKQKKETLKAGSGEVPEIVFHYGDGKAIAQNSIRKIFKRILRKAGLRERRIHDMRHTFASHLLSLGVSIFYVQRQLGHASIKMTCDTYGSWIPSQEKSNVNLLDSPNLTAPRPHPENEKAVTI
jgi:integrase